MGRDRRCSEFEAQHPGIGEDAAPEQLITAANL